MLTYSTKCFVVVDKESDVEYNCLSLSEAREKLVQLVMLGISAYIYTRRLI
jgi:hypothetical protein